MNSPRPREPMPDYGVTVTSMQGRLQVQVRGEVDLANRADLESALAGIDRCGVEAVCVDLTRLRFCDTGGCLFLTRFVVEAEQRGWTATIHGASSTVRRVMTFLSPAVADAFVDPAPAPDPHDDSRRPLAGDLGPFRAG